MDEGKKNQDEIQRRRLQEYIFALETKQEQAEDIAIEHEQIKQAQELLNAILDATTNGICLIKDDKVIWYNQGVADIFGWENNELIGKSAKILFLDADKYARMNKSIDGSTPKTEVITFESDFEHKNGRRIPCLVTHRPLDSRDMSKGYIISFTDFTERKHAENALKAAYDELEDRVEKRTEELNKINKQLQLELAERKRIEEALRESQEKYHAVLEGTPDPVIVYDIEGNVIYFNPAFTHVFGWTLKECLGRKMDLFVPEDALPETQMMINQVKAAEDFSGIESRRFTKEGEIIDVSLSAAVYRDSNGNTVGAVVNLRDISKHKQLESQLQQAHKMESIGTLAGGIAHDFNNILGIIVGNTELAMDDVPEWNPARRNLEEIRIASLRARDIVKQILAFSRMSPQGMKPVRISPIIKESFKLLRSSIPTTIEMHRNISSELDTVRADPTQINQVLINLCTNAAHSMGERGGVLEVSLNNIEMDGGSAKHYHDLSPGKYVRLTVSDTGHGIEPKIMERIFDPYFTTKGVGEGSGMGLSVVHGIVKAHGGDILVDSELGKGTAFQVFFPCTESKPEQEIEITVEIPRGNERILFVDDEKSMVDVIQPMIERLGYTVTARTSSIEGLEAFRGKPDRFDLVITDFTMPNMTGMELAKELLKLRSDIPIILCTGFSEHINEDKAKRSGVRAFLMKPVALGEIANTIRKVLDDN